MQNFDSKLNVQTFDIESLKPPEKLIETESVETILSQYSNKIEANRMENKELVNRGAHPFMAGLYHAYSEHRPFTLSPDMLWLLINQGVSNHINFAAGTENEVFPNLSKQELVVRDDRILLGKPEESPWEEVPSQFTSKIAEVIGASLVDALRADFSTSTTATQVACDITIMDSFKSYFEYTLMACVCGIPTIHLEGTTEDWQKIKHKLKTVETLGLAWWTERLYPIIDELIASSKGDFNKEFWMNMFKIHTEDTYGHPKKIDGWILNFFPYDVDGNKFTIGTISWIFVEQLFKHLPKEIVTVDFKYKLYDLAGNLLKEEPMEFWAGFIGLSQKSDFTLRPEIGWFVTYKEEVKIEQPEEYASVTFYNVETIPEELYVKEHTWGIVKLNFKDEIKFDENLLLVKAEEIILNGKISKDEKEKFQNICNQKDINIVVNEEYLSPDRDSVTGIEIFPKKDPVTGKYFSPQYDLYGVKMKVDPDTGEASKIE